MKMHEAEEVQKFCDLHMWCLISAETKQYAMSSYSWDNTKNYLAPAAAAFNFQMKFSPVAIHAKLFIDSRDSLDLAATVFYRMR